MADDISDSLASLLVSCTADKVFVITESNLVYVYAYAISINDATGTHHPSEAT